MSLDVYVVNESTLFSEEDTWRTAWALDYQARYHAGRSGWRSDVRVYYVQKGVKPTILAGHAILHLLDNSDQQGALGYHDEDGNEVPYARVFVETTQQAGDSVSECASHELLEMMADPNVNLCAINQQGNRLYAVEVGDPVQGTDYDVGEPEGKTIGIRVANFALPSYFDANVQPGKRLDFRGVLNAPFTISPQGYMSYVDLSNVQAGWQQEFGAERTSPPPPDADDRNHRRIAGVASSDSDDKPPIQPPPSGQPATPQAPADGITRP